MAQNWKDIEGDTKEKYGLYLTSREWAEKREAVRERARNRCERCRCLPMDACHHLTYTRKYHELPEDLQAICNPCHEYTHGKSSYDPKADFSWRCYVDESRNGARIMPVGPGVVEGGRKKPGMYVVDFCMARAQELNDIDADGAGDLGSEYEDIADEIGGKLRCSYLMWLSHGMPKPISWPFENEFGTYSPIS